MDGQRIGWIGSANLTRPGFQQNDEAVFEFLDGSGKASQWFDDQWRSLGDDEDCNRTLDRYEKAWKPPSWPARRPFTRDGSGIPAEIFDVARSLTDWASFVAAIAAADRYWRSMWEWSVTGESDSWLETITRGRAIARKRDWSKLSDDDRHLLLGRNPYGFLGVMGGAGHANNVFRAPTRENLRIRRAIREALQPVIDANDDDFAGAACDFIAVVEEIPGFGGAIATRFLALARPDRAVSVNAGSNVHLSKLTGLPKNSLSNAPHGRARSYLDLLHWFEEQAWYSSPAPGNAYERLLAAARAALIDAFVYAPTTAS